MPLTRENMEDLLFGIVNFEHGEPLAPEIKPVFKQKQGIFLRYKHDIQTKKDIIFVRLLSSKNSQKERVDWLEIGRYRIKVDLTKGFVSTSYLESLENVNNSQNKLKI